jgi:pyruvate,orthophosphate dikinase
MAKTGKRAVAGKRQSAAKLQASRPKSQARSKAKKTATKYVYFFGNGKAEGDRTLKNLLGGKGANLAEMTNAGLPVPPGFTISTEACNAYFQQGSRIPASIDQEMLGHLKKLEAVSGASFGSAEKPLLVSVRSGAKFSMPGMMDTILNLGLNDVTVEGLK